MRAMKDSGVEWIGEIPEGWGINKLKYIAKVNPGTIKQIKELTMVGYLPMDSLKNGVMIPREIEYQEVTSGLVPFQEHDIVMAKVTPCFENGNIAIADKIKNGIGYGSSELFVFRCINILTEYLFYCLQCNSFIDAGVATMTGTGGLKRVSPYFIRNLLLPFPSYQAQSNIVRFLNSVCAQIDAIIEKQQQVIEKLKAYKQSVITEAVTKGLDPAVPMKDSGVEWIGMVPEHWNMSKVKYVALFNPSRKRIIEQNEVIGYVPMDCVKNGFMQPQEIEFAFISQGLTYFETNDIIIAKVTPCFENGNIAIASGIAGDCAFGSSELFVFRCHGIQERYLFYLFQNQSFMQACIATMTGTGGLKRVSPDFIRNSYIPLPDEQTQAQISYYLDDISIAVDNAVSRKQTIVEKLVAYKKSLIYEAVTGKMEVS